MSDGMKGTLLAFPAGLLLARATVTLDASGQQVVCVVLGAVLVFMFGFYSGRDERVS